MITLPALQRGQTIVITPDDGGPRLILTHRTGTIGAREWVEWAASRRSFDSLRVLLVDADATETVLGTCTAAEVEGWP